MSPYTSTLRLRLEDMGRPAVLSLLAIVIAAPIHVGAHPICYFGERNPILDYESPLGFCANTEKDGFCCDPTEETEAMARYEMASVTGVCADYHKQVHRQFHCGLSSACLERF